MMAETATGHAAPPKWDGEADVIVVGFGGAGACAAIEASQQGADVLMFDRFAAGGATARSGGVVYAGGTHVQARLGVDDDWEEMYRYLAREVQGAVSEEVVQQYCRDSAANIRWLEQLGVDYSGSAFLGKTDYPPDPASLYFAGNENRSDNAEMATPAARGHRPLGKGLSGRFYFDALRRATTAHDVRVCLHSPVVGLLRNMAGDVLGVEVNHLPESVWKRRNQLYNGVGVRPFNAKRAAAAKRELEQMEAEHGTRKAYRARGGVILTTGGFAENDTLLETHAPQIAHAKQKMVRLSSLGCDGSGIVMGSAAGGHVAHMGNLLISRNLAPKSIRASAIVNRDGIRFLNEDAYNGDLGREIAKQPGGKAWLVMDRDLLKTVIGDFFSCPRGSFKTFYLPTMINALFGGASSSRSLSGLARKCGMDARALEETICDYNALVSNPEDDPFRKAPELFARVEKPPFLALEYSLDNPMAFNAFFTLGGLAVDEASGAVLDSDNHPIGGLFAAGRTAAGLCSRSYVSGLSLGDGVFSGRRAGRHAARSAGKVHS